MSDGVCIKLLTQLRHNQGVPLPPAVLVSSFAKWDGVANLFMVFAPAWEVGRGLVAPVIDHDGNF